MEAQKIDLYTFLRDHPFTKGLSDEKIAQLAEISSLVRFPAGQKIFEEDEIQKKLYLIVYGLVGLSFHLPARGDFRFETIGAGEVLGWSSLVPPFKKTSSAVALENTLAVLIDSEKLLRMMEKEKEFGYEVYRRLIEVVASRLKATRIRLLDIYGMRPS